MSINVGDNFIFYKQTTVTLATPRLRCADPEVQQPIRDSQFLTWPREEKSTQPQTERHSLTSHVEIPPIFINIRLESLLLAYIHSFVGLRHRSPSYEYLLFHLKCDR